MGKTRWRLIYLCLNVLVKKKKDACSRKPLKQVKTKVCSKFPITVGFTISLSKLWNNFSFPERAIDLDLLSVFLKLPICFIYCFYLFLFWTFTCDSLKYFFLWISEGNGITYACILYQSRSYYVYFVATLNPKLMC